MSEPRRPDDRAEKPTGEDSGVRRPAQGPLSPGASEPGDLGGGKPGERESPPRESPRGDGGSGYRGG